MLVTPLSRSSLLIGRCLANLIVLVVRGVVVTLACAALALALGTRRFRRAAE